MNEVFRKKLHTLDEHLMVLLCPAPDLSSSDSNPVAIIFLIIQQKRGLLILLSIDTTEEKINRFLNLKILRMLLASPTALEKVEEKGSWETAHKFLPNTCLQCQAFL